MTDVLVVLAAVAVLAAALAPLALIVAGWRDPQREKYVRQVLPLAVKHSRGVLGVAAATVAGAIAAARVLS